MGLRQTRQTKMRGRELSTGKSIPTTLSHMDIGSEGRSNSQDLKARNIGYEAPPNSEARESTKLSYRYCLHLHNCISNANVQLWTNIRDRTLPCRATQLSTNRQRVSASVPGANPIKSQLRCIAFFEQSCDCRISHQIADMSTCLHMFPSNSADLFHPLLSKISHNTS